MRTPAAPTIELGPNHKTGLQLASPVMTAAGCYGLGSEYQGLVDIRPLGAVVVGPVTMRARTGTTPPRAVPLPGGILLHAGLANPGLKRVLQRQRRAWERSPVPVILHLAATTSEEVGAACQLLDDTGAVAALELGLPDATETGEALALVRVAGAAYGRGPLLVRLPLGSASRLAAEIVEAGAHALTVAAPPRGTALHAGRPVTGRLYGQLVHPLALRALRQVREEVGVPLIGCGGIYGFDDALAFLRAGALAVQLDAVIWQDPSSAARIARELALALSGSPPSDDLSQPTPPSSSGSAS